MEFLACIQKFQSAPEKGGKAHCVVNVTSTHCRTYLYIQGHAFVSCLVPDRDTKFERSGVTLSLGISRLVVPGPNGQSLVEIDELHLPAGQLLGIKGPSGAGKSTLLFAMAGLLTKTHGHITWGDTDILMASPTARTAFRANSMGLVFQDYLLFDALGAQDNASLTALFAPKKQRAAIRARAARHLEHLSISLSRRSIATYSGGEQQRVALARALASDPAVVLADEPTANLDRDTAQTMTDDLISLVRATGKTMVVVSHDDRLLSRMDQILGLDGGRPQ